MSRPVKCRKVCHFPENLEFVPVQKGKDSEPVILNLDEYETIRLLDKEGMSQEQCSEFMQVARTTVQRIYESARKKTAVALVEGRPLRIEGGDFRLCDGKNASCGFESCFKQQLYIRYKRPKEEGVIRIAVPYEKGEIFQHFGRSRELKIYDIKKKKLLEKELITTEGNGHGALTGILNALAVDVLLCGGIGSGARMALEANEIAIYGGRKGDADSAVEAFLKEEVIDICP